jgi:uncharacterized protein YgiM (DUF1202 family)
MLKSRFLTLITIAMLLLASCAPIFATPSPIVTEEPGIPVTGVAVVQSVEIQILESRPLQVHAILRGQLPDAGCTTIASVDQSRNGNTIDLTVKTTTDPLALCAQALTPFEHIVPLDVRDLPAGKYNVRVSGIEQSFELPAHDATHFQAMLIEALNARDYERLKAFIGDSFMIGYWQSEGTSNTPEQAIEQLRLNLLASTSPITADPNKDLVALLGTDPVTIAGPDATEASPLFTSGWGQEGKDEAILFTAKRPNGHLYWYGLLFAKDGFAQAGPIVVEPIDSNAYPTSVQYVMAQQDLTIYNGPAESFPIVGQVFNGQIAKVTGTNVYGNWWRIACPDSSAGNCWVPGHPAFTLPTTMPHENYPPPVESEPTDVEYVLALKDVFIRNGPGRQYGIVSSLAEGQIAKVTGVSADGNWWRVICPDDTIGSCWVSASSNLTQPTTVPHSDQPLPPGDPRPTDVKYVMAQQDAPIHGGPEAQYSIIGSIAAGQTALVTAVSADGNWWQVICPDNSVGNCWVSANPAYTQPTQGPG